VKSLAVTNEPFESNSKDAGRAANDTGWGGGVDLSLLALLFAAIWTGSLLGAIGGLIAWLAFDRSFLLTFVVIWLAYFTLLCVRRLLAR